LAGLDNVFTLRTIADAQGLAPHLVPDARLVVVGAGFIGAEVASAAASRGMEVTMINNTPVPFAVQLGEDMGAVVANLHTNNGVKVISDAVIEEFRSSEGRLTGIRLADGQELAVDVVVVGIGAEPNIEWLAGSGVELGAGVLCDPMGRTNVPGIVAVGDCAAWFDESTGTHHRVEHWTGALERGALAVQALLDEDAPQQPHKPHYFWSDQHGVKIQFAGHSAGYDRLEIEAGDPEEHSFLAVYYRNDVPVAVLGMNQPKLFTKWRRSLGKSAPKADASRLVAAATP
jgi:NADPH-dependent 2,4-dienoyl-CoA reductase/sulfur reductase-like enzyme